jgi:hypothetical protein
MEPAMDHTDHSWRRCSSFSREEHDVWCGHPLRGFGVSDTKPVSLQHAIYGRRREHPEGSFVVDVPGEGMDGEPEPRRRKNGWRHPPRPPHERACCRTLAAPQSP